MKTKTMEQLVTDLAPIHYFYLKQLAWFPMECVWSSHMIGAYLYQIGFPVEVVYGTYGPHHLFHAWVKVGEEIIDYTLFQFLTNKERDSFYRKISKEDMTSYALENQGAFMFNKNQPVYYLYEEIATIEHQFIDDEELQHLDNYSSFYERVWQKGGYSQYGILDAVVKGESKTFEEKLKELHLQFGKKFFTKKCIIKS